MEVNSTFILLGNITVVYCVHVKVVKKKKRVCLISYAILWSKAFASGAAFVGDRPIKGRLLLRIKKNLNISVLP